MESQAEALNRLHFDETSIERTFAMNAKVIGYRLAVVDIAGIHYGKEEDEDEKAE